MRNDLMVNAIREFLLDGIDIFSDRRRVIGGFQDYFKENVDVEPHWRSFVNALDTGELYPLLNAFPTIPDRITISHISERITKRTGNNGSDIVGWLLCAYEQNNVVEVDLHPQSKCDISNTEENKNKDKPSSLSVNKLEEGTKTIPVFSPTSCKIFNVYVSVGDRVRPGDVLCMIDVLGIRSNIITPMGATVNSWFAVDKVFAITGANFESRDILFSLDKIEDTIPKDSTFKKETSLPPIISKSNNNSPLHRKVFVKNGAAGLIDDLIDEHGHFEIPHGYTVIGDYAFKDCEKLITISIPNSVTIIESRAFVGCKNLTSIEMPNSIASIGEYAFFGCFSLINIKPFAVPDKVTNIGDCVFRLTALTNISVSPNNKNYQSDNGVLFNKNKTSLLFCPRKTDEYTIPDGVLEIEELAFESNWIESINIPDSVTNIKESAFTRCSSLTEVLVSSENPNYSSKDGVLFNKNMDTLIYCPEGKTGEYSIPVGVKNIKEYAFSDCSLKSIIIPNSVTRIGDRGFYECESLTNMVLPNSVTTIDSEIFEGCKNLIAVAIPDSVVNIKDFAFCGCENTTIYCHKNSFVFKYCQRDLYTYEDSVKKKLILNVKCLDIDNPIIKKVEPEMDADIELALSLYQKCDFKGAYEIINKLAKSKHPRALNFLGAMYENGEYVEQDKKKAFELYSKSYKLGSLYGECSVGVCYFYGTCTEVNEKKGIEMLEAASLKGFDNAKYQLSYIYQNGYYYGEINNIKAAEIYEQVFLQVIKKLWD